MAKKLEGLRVAVLAADGFEQVELTRPVKRLKREGAHVEILSLHPGSMRGMNLLVPGKKVSVDSTLREVKAADDDALLLPFAAGGWPRGRASETTFTTRAACGWTHPW